MESKEIYTVLLAALGIILVIGILSLVTKPDSDTQQDSMPAITKVTQQNSNFQETDIWDLLREQNTTTATTATSAVESAGSGIETGISSEGAVTILSSDGIVVTESSPGSETETAAVTEPSNTAPVEPPQSYHLIIP